MESAEAELKLLVEEEAKLADHVRNIKKNGASKAEVDAEVAKLKEAKAKVEAKKKSLAPPDFNKQAFARLMTQRFFLSPSFEIYGGVAGLYDLGPPGTAIKANLLNLWRNHFVLQENMLEVDCTSVTPEPVLVASGHVAKFSDYMVTDLKTGACYRADHLLEAQMETLLAKKDLTEELRIEYANVSAQADAFSQEKLGECLAKYNVKAPETGNDISGPEPFNLMFQTQIGPTGKIKGFLRPETAQGIFVNFKRLLEYNGGKLPFAAAQIGQAYRNEIAPRSGLLRVREFTLAEIEHFVNPSDKAHPKFKSIGDHVLNLFPQDAQVSDEKKTIKITVREAVEKKIIDNETLGYFLVRVHLFLLAAGIKDDRLRFRQHLKDEKAHYATDCWDAEIQNSYGWVECVGIADRSAYDLKAHTKFNTTREKLNAFVEFPGGPQNKEVTEIKIDKSAVGKKYKKTANILIDHLNNLDEQAIQTLRTQVEAQAVPVTVGTENFEVTKDIVSFSTVTKRVIGEPITPGVIEPSFGIGRILYSILEHAYFTREGDEQRAVLSLAPSMAPVKVSVLPLMAQPDLVALIPKITAVLSENNISFKVDDSGATIGKKYSRTDEIGVPFGITIDHETIKSDDVTLRERDSTTQVRVKIDEIATVIHRLVNNRITWEDVKKKYPAVAPPAEK